MWHDFVVSKLSNLLNNVFAFKLQDTAVNHRSLASVVGKHTGDTEDMLTKPAPDSLPYKI